MNIRSGLTPAAHGTLAHQGYRIFDEVNSYLNGLLTYSYFFGNYPQINPYHILQLVFRDPGGKHVKVYSVGITKEPADLFDVADLNKLKKALTVKLRRRMTLIEKNLRWIQEQQTNTREGILACIAPQM